MLQAEEISVDKIKSGMGGYKKKETKAFVDNIRSEYESLYKENQELKDKISVLSEGVQYYKNMENSLQKALVLAERTTTETVHAAEVKAAAMEKEAAAKAELIRKEAQIRAENCEKEANMKAETLIRDAKHKADLALAKGNEELQKVHSQVIALVQQYEQYKAQYKQLALAQMNVIESEAYNLDAPILKTIEEVLSKRTEEHDNSDTEENREPFFDSTDKGETKSFDMSDIMEPVCSENTTEEKKESEVYVDGRGQLFEVHEFREVTIPGAGEPDPYFDEDLPEEKDDWGEAPSMEKQSFETEDKFGMEDKFEAEDNFEMEEKNPADFFRPFETAKAEKVDPFLSDTEEKFSDSFMKEPEPVQNFLNEQAMTEEEPGREEKLNDPEMEVMRRIEREQLERLRREEEIQANRIKMGAGFGTQSFEQQEGKKVEEQKIEEVRLSKEEPATDFFSGLSAPAEEAPISLHELRMQQEEDNGYVSLPKPSNDSAYFSNSFSQGGEKEKKEESEIPPVSVNSFSEEQKEEKESADNFASFSSDWLTKGRTDDKAAENSIDFELEHTSFQSGEKIERGGFKSFRDFESEL